MILKLRINIPIIWAFQKNCSFVNTFSDVNFVNEHDSVSRDR